MNCTMVRQALPDLLYSDLPPDQTAALRQHLAHCSACRGELAALEGLRQKLDDVPAAPPVAVDLAKLYQAVSRLQDQRAQRWRRTALGLGAAAAGLLLFLGLLHLEVRFEGHQMVIRWSAPPTPEVPAPGPIVQAPPEVSPGEVKLLRSLVHALEADVRLRDQNQQQALAQLRFRLDSLQEDSDQRWADAERTRRAFYTALFGNRNPNGGRP
jgi:anti-sigma factor RsiW